MRVARNFCCVPPARAQQTPQTLEKRRSSKIGGSTHVDPPIFEKSASVRGFAAFAARLQAHGKQSQICAPQIPGPKLWEKRDGTWSGARQRRCRARAPNETAHSDAASKMPHTRAI